MGAREERKVICDECGEILDVEPIGGPRDPEPEMGDADHYVDPEACPFCTPE